MLSMSGNAPLEMAIINRFGGEEIHCFINDPCFLGELAPGGYFVRARNFDQQLQSFTLSLAWTEAPGGTLESGEYKQGLIIGSEASRLESLVLPVGVDRFTVQAVGAAVMVDVVDSTGNYLVSCFADEVCELLQPSEGSYFVRTYNGSLDPATVDLVAQWTMQ